MNHEINKITLDARCVCAMCLTDDVAGRCSGMLFIADNNDDDDIAVVPYCVSQHGWQKCVYSVCHDKTSKIIYCR